jgi:hypothetical protein
VDDFGWNRPDVLGARPLDQEKILGVGVGLVIEEPSISWDFLGKTNDAFRAAHGTLGEIREY